jgi:hypothetical protein
MQVVPTEFGTTKHPLFCLGFRKSTVAAAPSSAAGRGGLFGRWFSRGRANSSDTHALLPLRGHTHLPAASVAASAASPASAKVSTAERAAAKLLQSVSDVETVSADIAGRQGVEIQGLTKVFHGVDGTKTAVDNLTLKLYEGQVTCLLGHNGKVYIFMHGQQMCINVAVCCHEFAAHALCLCRSS